MPVDSRTKLDVFGPVRALLGADEDLTSAAAISALLVARCDEEHAVDWLHCACNALASMTAQEVVVHLVIVEPVAEFPGWRTLHSAVAGRAGREVLDAIAREIAAGCPSDDIASEAGHREMWPETHCQRRIDIVSGERWAGSAYRAWRRNLELGEFLRIVAPVEDHLGRPRTMIAQFDGAEASWTPDEKFIRAASVAAACVWSAYRDRFVAPLERAEQSFALLSPIRRRIARLIVAGKTESQIAEIIDRSKHTVRDHVKAMYHLLEVSSRKELVDRLSGVRRRRSALHVADADLSPEEAEPLPEVKAPPAKPAPAPARVEREADSSTPGKARRKSAAG